MAFPPSFKSTLSLTHIGTATALLTIDTTTFLTDPFFSPAGTLFPIPGTPAVLKNAAGPALTLADLPPIDAVLLSHEDHDDNLDSFGRQLLDGRKVLTTMDGARKLAPRPGVVGLRAWETVELVAGGKTFSVTGVPAEHLPGAECTGFMLWSETFGLSDDGRKNAVYFSGDTIYFPELVKIREKWNVVLALLNLGDAVVPWGGELHITMDGRGASRLVRDVGIGRVVPMHFEGWGHFTEGKGELERVFEEEGVSDRVLWLEPGVETRVV